VLQINRQAVKLDETISCVDFNGAFNQTLKKGWRTKLTWPADFIWQVRMRLGDAAKPTN
jgi:hypothetical protein